ncbi:hypothetical protein [Pantoea rodasii]|uniref:hypothetical protein n=1 Tax=Pantoea rodasii TaxID=1076549 RepID=UPI001FCDD6B2|nr:hypothetical protein [Pantoea rodasii]
MESISCFGDDMHDENTVLNLQKKIEETKFKLKNILDALQVASEVEALALKMKEVNKEIKNRRIQTTLIFREKQL